MALQVDLLRNRTRIIKLFQMVTEIQDRNELNIWIRGDNEKKSDLSLLHTALHIDMSYNPVKHYKIFLMFAELCSGNEGNISTRK